MLFEIFDEDESKRNYQTNLKKKLRLLLNIMITLNMLRKLKLWKENSRLTHSARVKAADS